MVLWEKKKGFVPVAKDPPQEAKRRAKSKTKQREIQKGRRLEIEDKRENL